MIARINDDQYLNIFEVAWLFIAAEFIITMNFLKLYDIDSDEWHYRRIFWCLAGLTAMLPMVAGLALGVAAALKYLW